MDTKVCTHCKKELALSEFYPSRGVYWGCCKSCKKEKQDIYREANRDKVRAQRRAYYHRNAEKISSRKKAYYQLHPEKDRARGMVRNFPSQPCMLCGKAGEKHHPNYLNPREVVFLCKSHHKQVHDGTISLFLLS